jgi:hypothetical protein
MSKKWQLISGITGNFHRNTQHYMGLVAKQDVGAGLAGRLVGY